MTKNGTVNSNRPSSVLILNPLTMNNHNNLQNSSFFHILAQTFDVFQNGNLCQSFHQTTFKLTGLSVSSSASGDSTITRKNSDGQIRIKCKSPVGKSDHALDELRRVEKDLEINLKITETLSKLNSANKEESSHSNKRTYVKRQQELLYRKYLKKLQVGHKILILSMFSRQFSICKFRVTFENLVFSHLRKRSNLSKES